MIKIFKEFKTFIGIFEVNLLIQYGSEDRLLKGVEKLNDLFQLKGKTINIYKVLYHDSFSFNPIIIMQDLSDL